MISKTLFYVAICILIYVMVEKNQLSIRQLFPSLLIGKLEANAILCMCYVYIYKFFLLHFIYVQRESR